ncbi:Aklanonic acid methyltransferase DauC [Frondihabitans sp. 762G35]|nr:Aklanonic acid methyltransferase DauC [Frondihabitans sp. 762G35]
MFASATAYDRFMGRYSRPLGRRFVDALGVRPGWTVLDVGCGPGALTEALVDVVGAASISAVDPSPAFVEACRERFPGVNVGAASAEALPFPEETFDLTAAQLVVHFMPDPTAGIREMSRVTKRGGVVAADVWDFAGGRGPLGVFDEAARGIDPPAPSERDLPGASAGDLERVFAAAGLAAITSTELTVSVDFASFDEWWTPFTEGVGPAGAWVSSLDVSSRDRLRGRAHERLGDRPFTVEATAFAVSGTVDAA